MTKFVDRYWTSRDGLKLHYRDYAGRDDRLPVVCLPGLTRNARDFAALAERLAGERRVICPDMRGRGDSAYAKDSDSYNPLQYVDDVSLLLDEAGISRFVSVGTSLGGLITMLLAMVSPERIAGALLNDIGPELQLAGVERIRGYLGQGRSFPTWMHAARALVETNGAAFPDYRIDDWLAMAKRVMVLSSNGRIVFDYDMKIAEPFAKLASGPSASASGASAPGDLWAAFDRLEGKPLLFIRGELSDLLSPDVLARMQARFPEAETVSLPRIGHAPTLDEPEVIAALSRLLAKVA
jgi:pimeloyl-ACP methyl ester carboxylesterase